MSTFTVAELSVVSGSWSSARVIDRQEVESLMAPDWLVVVGVVLREPPKVVAQTIVMTRPTTEHAKPAIDKPLLVALPERVLAKPMLEKMIPRMTSGQAAAPAAGMNAKMSPTRPRTKPVVPSPFLGAEIGMVMIILLPLVGLFLLEILLVGSP